MTTGTDTERTRGRPTAAGLPGTPQGERERPDQEIRRLADEAEAGYDPARLRRVSGGPSASSIHEGFVLRPGSADDAGWMADLKAEAMRADLERLGRWDPVWARQRFLDAYVPANTSVIEVGGRVAGIVAARKEADVVWIEHFYLHAHAQGHGLGGRVLDEVMSGAGDERPFALVVVRESAARRLYERHGFVHRSDAENGVDQVFST